MNSCNVYKKKFLIGCSLVFLGALMKPISENIIDLRVILTPGWFITIAIIVIFVGIYLMLPYVRCLSDYNKIGKPPS